MKPRHIVLGVALVIAAGFAIFGDKTPAGAAVGSTTTARATGPAKPAVTVRAASTPAPASTPPASTLAPDVAILRLEPRETLISGAGEGATGFGPQNWTPPPPPPQPAPPPPPPMAPALPFAYLGKAVSNGEWEVFLARGDQTLIVRNRMIIDGVYRVESIEPPGLTFTYLPLKQVQQLNIGVRD